MMGRFWVCIGALLAGAVPALAAPTSCPAHYHGGQAPDIVHQGLAAKLVEVCHEGFGVFHSGLSAGPLWSAQRLTAERVIAAKAVDRVDAFHAEPSLSSGDRAELQHYRGSGFDRGHLAPSADMATASSQHSSFSLSNIVPQHPDHNRGLWAELEATARGLAFDYGEIYVVTGVAFTGTQVNQIGGRVVVPTVMFKAIYIPSAGAASAWWSPNEAPGTAYEVISIADLNARSGLAVFPGLDAAVMQTAVRLPDPSREADTRITRAASLVQRDQGAATVPAASNGAGIDYQGLAGNVARRVMRGMLP